MKLFSQKLSRAKRSSPLNPNIDDPEADSSSQQTQPQPPANPTSSKSEATSTKQSGRTQQKRKLYPFNIDRKGKDSSRHAVHTNEQPDELLGNDDTTAVSDSNVIEPGSFDSTKPQFVQVQPPNAVWAVDTEQDMAKKPPALPAPMPSPSELSRAIAEAAHARFPSEPITSSPIGPEDTSPTDEKGAHQEVLDKMISDNNHPTLSSPPFRKSSPPPTTILASSSRTPDASFSAVTTSAEISNPPSTTSSSSKLRSVPIPQPLLLKRHTSRSSFSSADDATNYSPQQSTPSSAHIRHSLSASNFIDQRLTDSTTTIPALSPITSSAGSQDEQDDGSPALSAQSSGGNNSPAAAMSPVNGHPNTSLRRKMSYLQDTDYGSSASEAEPSDIQGGNTDQAIPSAASSFTNDSPISQSQIVQGVPNQPCASASPKYASPPVGSGGKYMLKSKRASWIDANAANPPPISTNFSLYGDGSSGSTPSTPISGPESIRQVHSRKNSIAEGMNTMAGSPGLVSSQSAYNTATYSPSLAASKELDEREPTTTTARLHKTGSLSRIGESSGKGISAIRRRESSSDFPSSSSEGSSRFADIMPKRLPRRSSTLDSINTDQEDGIDNQSPSSLPPPYALPSGYRDLFQHKRTPSLSSTLTANSIDENSPLASPAVRNPPSTLNLDETQSGSVSPVEQRAQIPLSINTKSLTSSNRERTASSSALMASSSSPKTSAQTKAHRRRSSMSMLRKIPTEELANIVSGSSPNPVVLPPMAESFNRQRSRTHTIATSNLSSIQTFESDSNENEADFSSQSRPSSLPLYQNSLHSLLKKQFHAHSDQDRQSYSRRSSSLADKDRDVTEMRLDDEGPTEGLSNRSRHSRKILNAMDFDPGLRELRAPIFPSSLLNTPYPVPVSKKDNKKLMSITRATASTSAPSLLQEDDESTISATELSSWSESSSMYRHFVIHL